jgi:hypothetical protein
VYIYIYLYICEGKDLPVEPYPSLSLSLSQGWSKEVVSAKGGIGADNKVPDSIPPALDHIPPT